MANYKAIAAIGQVIVKLLKDASLNEFPNAEFRLLQTAEFASKQYPKEGATVWLYRVEANNAVRNLLPRPGSDPGGKPSRPAIQLELKFLISLWASDPEQQNFLLGWIIRLLGDTPILPATLLNQMASKNAIFSLDETVELIFEPLPLPELAGIFQILKQPEVLFPSVSYRASLMLED